MKTITTGASIAKADSSLDAALNPVQLSSKETVSWAKAFPRPRADAPPRTAIWRTDATIGTVLGVAGRMAAAEAADGPESESV